MCRGAYHHLAKEREFLMLKRLCRILAGAAAAYSLVAGTALAQTVNGYATIIEVPVVVISASFTSEIYVHNPLGVSTQISPTFYGGDGTLNVGAHGCPTITVLANTTNLYSLSGLCPALNFSASTFGRLYLYEIETTNHPFTAYVRVNSAQGNGFSIEGFPIGEINNTWGNSWVNGLKRQASAPGYQSNCFIGGIGEAVNVDLSLFTNTGTQLGATQHYVLTANQFVRILDVFTAVGAAAGDYTQVRARFLVPSTVASFIAFCTVQNNTSFDADFRIAKSIATATVNSNDQSRQFTVVQSFSSGTTTDGGGNLLPAPDTTVQHNWAIFMRNPDWVACSVTSQTPAGSAEMRLLAPDKTTVIAGGDFIDTFGETYLGEKSTQNSGNMGLWHIQVGDNGFGPVTAYTLTCTGGNGLSRPIYEGTGPDTF